MAKNGDANETPLGALMDDFIADILSASDQEILEDDEELARVSGISTDKFIQAAIDTASLSIGKMRFEQTARDLKEVQAREVAGVTDLNRERLRRRYEDSLRQSGHKLSMAARGGTSVSKRDLDSAIEDLSELGGLDEDTDHTEE